MKPMTLAGVVAAMAMVGAPMASESVAQGTLLLDVSIRRGGFEILSTAQVRATMDEVAHIQLDDRYTVHVIPKAGVTPRHIRLEVLIEDVQVKNPIVLSLFAMYGGAVPVPLGGDGLQRLELVAWSK
jgi:hypothetical protein